ncbi:MAG TPA: MlaD family protein [Candidatus Angelobacter sp.]|nr:MlaD family protein [Candidatus Angelobacter sp.]
MPSQQQLKWSELRVGITVTVATVTLGVLVFLLSGTVGVFSSKITIFAYFDNAEGLKKGGPVDLQGVTIGNVSDIRVVPNHPDKPVQVTMRVNTKYQFLLRKDSIAKITTAGVLGESFIDVDSRTATLGPIQDGDTLQSANAPGFQEVVRASQSTLENMDILVKRLDRIIASVESGEGTIGGLIKDPALLNKANSLLGQMQKIVNDVGNGKGSIGKLLVDEGLYHRVDVALDKLDKIVTDIQNGQGNLGKLLKDESIFKNLQQTSAKANDLMENINTGHGAIGKLARDEELAKKLDMIITNLAELSKKLNAPDSTVGRLLNNPSVYNNTDQMLVETRNLVKAIRENPKKYLTIHLRIF